MPNKWIIALKQWNTEKGGPYCVPRKGSADYDAVKALMSGPAPAPAPTPAPAPKKKLKIPKDSPTLPKAQPIKRTLRIPKA